MCYLYIFIAVIFDWILESVLCYFSKLIHLSIDPSSVFLASYSVSIFKTICLELPFSNLPCMPALNHLQQLI